ncbi:MAG: tetratricopeptide repeat protein [Saprospiraceae bacterium]|nr:tetratricopeptide repeat protein [Saprospiraceae bacterium]
MTTPASKPRLWAMPRQIWQKMDPKKADSWLAAVMGVLLRSAGILLLIFAALIIWRMLKNQGYVLEAFSVPKALDEAGFSGRVAAIRLQDAIQQLKTEAASVKKDELNVGNNDDNAAMNVQVMGVEISLNSIAYQLRHLLGRKQKRIVGEFVSSGNQLSLLLRMTDYPNVRFETPFETGKEEQASQYLLALAAEKIIERNDPYRLAVYYYRRKKYGESIDLARIILRERPQERTWAYHIWANILSEQGRFEEALEKYQQVLQIDSNFSISQSQMAHTLLLMKRTEEALPLLEKAMSLNADNPDGWLTLGWHYATLGEMEKSDQAFSKAIPVAARWGKESVAWQSWISSKMEHNDLVAAQKLAEKALATVTETSDGYVTRSIVYLLQKDTLKAFENVQKALDLDPSNPMAANLYGRALFMNKRYDQLTHFVRDFRWPAYMLQVKTQLTNLSAMAHNYAGRHDSALAVVQRGIAMDTTFGLPYTTLAETYAFQGKTNLFYTALEKAFKLGVSPDQINWQAKPYADFRDSRRLLRLKEQFSKPK